jgi:hypothetical protein
MDQNVVNCQVKALKCDNNTLGAAYSSCASVDQKLRRHEAFGCN